MLISSLSLTIGEGIVFITTSYFSKSKSRIGKTCFANACAGRTDDVDTTSKATSNLPKIFAIAAPVRPNPIIKT